MTEEAIAIPAVEIYPPPGLDESETDTFAARLLKIAGKLESYRGVTGKRGRLAVLRRMSPDDCDGYPEVYWELAGDHKIPASEDRLWARLLPLMARYPHDGRVAPGVAFARAEVTPARLQRWLRAEHDEAWEDAPRLLARVDDAGVDWKRLGLLLRWWTPEGRRQTAREYFRSPEYLRRKTADPGA